MLGNVPAIWNSMTREQRRSAERRSKNGTPKEGFGVPALSSVVTEVRVGYARKASRASGWLASENRAPRVLILVGIHGDEQCGLRAMNELLRDGFFGGQDNIEHTAPDVSTFEELVIESGTGASTSSRSRQGRRASALVSTMARAARGSHAAQITPQELRGSDNQYPPPPGVQHCFIPEESHITIAVGNPSGVEANKRFLDENLNRCIGSGATTAGSSRERMRAVHIEALIRSADVVLDLHSTSSPTPPFALPSSDPLAEQLAEHLPVSYVIPELAHNTRGGGTTVDYARSYGIPAVCVECGQHLDRDTDRTARAVIERFIHLIHAAPDAIPATVGARVRRRRSGGACVEHAVSSALHTATVDLTNTDQVTLFDEHVTHGTRSVEREAYRTTLFFERGSTPKAKRLKYVGVQYVQKGFAFRKRVGAFERVGANEVVAEDHAGAIRCQESSGCFLVMPTAAPVEGEEAWFWTVHAEEHEEKSAPKRQRFSLPDPVWSGSAEAQRRLL